MPLLWRVAPWGTGLLSLVLVIQGVVPTISIYLTKLTVDELARVLTGSGSAAYLLIVAWVAVLALSQLLAPINQAFQGNVAEKFTAFINLELMKKAEQLPGLGVLEDPEFFDDLSVLQEGAKNRPLNLVVNLVYTLRDLVTTLSLIALLASLTWWIPLVLLLSVWPHAHMTLRLREIGWRALISRSPEARRMEYDSRVALSYDFALETRLFGLFPWLRERYSAIFERSHRTMRRVRARQAASLVPSSLLSIVVAGGLFGWVILQAGLGAFTLGGIVVVVQGLFQMQALVMALVEGFGQFFERALYFETYFRFTAATPSLQRPAVPQALPAQLKHLSFENVTFRYPDGRVALSEVSFGIRAGETVAIVGENGAGKTTLIKLLLRFYDPTEGTVKVDGLDLRTVDLDAWRARVAAVFQNFNRYAYTLGENIRIGDVSAPWDDEGLSQALEEVGLIDLLDTLNAGLRTPLGKEFGGTDLSGGQWQKLGMARALFRDAEVLILDEPTAALDPRSEYELYQRFARLASGRTTILITHRLSSVRTADRILVLKEGRLIEEGSHSTLLAAGGEYADLWAMQAQRYGADVQGGEQNGHAV